MSLFNERGKARLSGSTTMRRTLDLPDAPGVWLWKREAYFACVQVYASRHNGKLYYYNIEQDECQVDVLRDDFPGGGQWQGPIVWEEPPPIDSPNEKP